MTATLRVAVDARHASAPTAWGSAAYVRELVRALAGVPGLETVALRGGRGPDVAWEQLGLPRALRAGGFDAVHAPNCFLPLRRPCPGVVTVHDLAFEAFPRDFGWRSGAKYRTLVPRAVRSAQRIVCVSEFTRRDVCARYGVDPQRTRVVLSAPALPAGDAPAPPGPYLLAVGALRAKKNLRRLVEAWLALRHAGLEHRLVLAGPDAGEARALRAAAGTAPLELPGQVSDRELDALMRGADLLVHPSLHEGFGLAPLEAMARGTPVALARATALPEAGGDAAEYFEPLDASDLARAIRRALERAGELATRGRERAAGFSWERTAAQTAAVYREAAGA